MLRWHHEQLVREIFSPPLPKLYYITSPSLILSLLVLHMPPSVCGVTVCPAAFPLNWLYKLITYNLSASRLAYYKSWIMEVLPRPFLSLQKSLLSGSLQLKFLSLTTRILFLTLAWQLGENDQSPLVEQPSSQLTILLVLATCLILICIVKIHGKSWRVCWQKLDVLVGAVLWYVIPVKRKLSKGKQLVYCVVLVGCW